MMSATSILTNLYIMLPLYMRDVAFSAKLNLTLYTIVPFNFIRGIVLSVITILIYKRISKLIKR